MLSLDFFSNKVLLFNWWDGFRVFPDVVGLKVWNWSFLFDSFWWPFINFGIWLVEI